MMQLKILKFAGIAAFATTLLTSCSDENHAGVLTETESGTTIASIVRDENGQPVASAKVNLISTTHIAARMAPIKTTMTDEEGRYTIDSISAGEYALQISNTEHTLSAYQTLSIEENKSSLQALSIPEAKLEKNASLELGLSSYGLSSGDTLCITGTLNCAGVGDKDVNAGFVTISEIPPMEFTKITLIRGAGRDTSTRDVKWDFVPGEKLEVFSPIQSSSSTKESSSSQASNTISVTITDEVMTAAKKLNGNKTLESMIVPVTISKNIKNPVLLDKNGDTLSLYKVENDKDESRYLAMIPSIDTGTYKFTVSSSDKTQKPYGITRAIVETTQGMKVSENDYRNDFIVDSTSNSLGISFWIEEKNTAPKNSDSILLDSKENDVTYRLRTGDKPEELCANFYKRDSTDSTWQINYTTLLNSYCHDVLDGIRHHYVMFIKANHIVIAIDGKIVEDSEMVKAFILYPGFTTGTHKLENLTVFSLKQTAISQKDDSGWERLHAWLSAFYMLQK